MSFKLSHIWIGLGLGRQRQHVSVGQCFAKQRFPPSAHSDPVSPQVPRSIALLFHLFKWRRVVQLCYSPPLRFMTLFDVKGSCQRVKIIHILPYVNFITGASGWHSAPAPLHYQCVKCIIISCLSSAATTLIDFKSISFHSIISRIGRKGR